MSLQVTARPATVLVPTTTPTPEPSVSPTPAVVPTKPAQRPRFVVEAGVSDADVATVVSALDMAMRYAEDRFGGRARERIVVIVTTGRLCASEFHGGDGVICIDIANPGWSGRTEYEKVATVAHEYFHNLQTEIGCRFAPIWLGEGSAEYFGYAVSVENRLVDYAQVRAQHVQRIQSSPPLPPLEEGDLLSDGAMYSLRFIAVEQLLNGGDLLPYRHFCQAIVEGTGAGDAFATAFGVSFDAFFSRFAAYRAENGL